MYGNANGQPAARLGITVSRKVSTHAVIRNRIKRQVRECFRSCQNDLIGLDLVVVARRAAVGESSTAVCLALQNHWKRLKRQCAPCSPL